MHIPDDRYGNPHSERLDRMSDATKCGIVGVRLVQQLGKSCTATFPYHTDIITSMLQSQMTCRCPEYLINIDCYMRSTILHGHTYEV